MMTTPPEANEGELAAVTTLAQFRRTVRPISQEKRDQIIQQALVLIDQLYVHLPLKRAMHAVNPVQRLELLRRRAAAAAEALSDRQFHNEMIAIFTGLRDLHTRYLLPAAYRGRTAMLPFRVQEFLERREEAPPDHASAQKPHYVVTEAAPELIPDPHFREGVFVLDWNGVSMDRAVEVNADRHAGSNWEARHARGLNTMTKRPLDTGTMPDEDWVVVGYQDDDGRRREARFDWLVLEPELAPTAVDPHAPAEPHALALGIDLETEAVRRSRKTIFSPGAITTEKEIAALTDQERIEPGKGPPGMSGVSAFPDALQFGTRPTSDGNFGYLRIRTFLVREVNLFLAEIVRILELLPPTGLIVDVRGNPGGVIMNGELLLQLFTPRHIEPERLHFINTPLTRELCERVPELEAWKGSIADSVVTATPFSDGFPMTSVADCNAVGQRYYGPTVLIVDALCYSATDIFIAGWQDHKIGPIIGTGENTGAGGANVWEHADLLERFTGPDSPIQPLPEEASFSVAIRRTTRVGDRSGDPLEDLGVIPDHVHRLTLDDLLDDNRDLLDEAGKILAARPLRSLAVQAARTSDGSSASVKVTTNGISRLDAYVDGRPRQTLDLLEGQATFEVPIHPEGSTLELKGFDQDSLVAARRLRL
jgi:Peptidase family S41